MKFSTCFPRFLIIAFFTLTAALPALAQDNDSFKETFLEAESYFLFEEYADALPLYQQLLRSDPGNYNISYKIGVCYLNDRYQAAKSVAYLETAIKGTNNSYRINNYRERMAPTEAFYYLGNAYRVNNRLDEAIQTY